MEFNNWQITAWIVILFFIINYMISRTVIYRQNRSILLDFHIPGSGLVFVISIMFLNIILNIYSGQYKNSEVIIKKEKTAIRKVLLKLDAWPDSLAGIFSHDFTAYLENRVSYFSEYEGSYKALHAKLKADSLVNRLWINLMTLRKTSENRTVTAALGSVLNDLFTSEARRMSAGLTRYMADLFFIISLSGILAIIAANQRYKVTEWMVVSNPWLSTITRK